MFQIGEFSRIAQVSGRQLRFYAQLGLLQPGHVDPQSGYRYYTADQLPRLNRILALKELGFSLDEIRAQLDRDVSPAELRGMLTLKRAQVSQLVQEEQARLALIESRIEQIDLGTNQPSIDLVAKPIAARHFLSMRATMPDMATSYDIFGRILREVPRVIHAGRLRSPAVLMHFDELEWEQMDIQAGFLIDGAQPVSLTISSGHVLGVSELPAIPRAITAVRRGSIEAGHSTYQAIGRHIAANKLRLDGLTREVFLQMPSDSDPGIVEVQVPVAG